MTGKRRDGRGAVGALLVVGVLILAALGVLIVMSSLQMVQIAALNGVIEGWGNAPLIVAVGVIVAAVVAAWVWIGGVF